MWKAIQHGGLKIIFLVRLVALARLLSPEDFGLLAIALVAVNVLMRLTDLGMIPALVQRGDIEERHFDAAWTVGITRGLAITVVVVLAAPLIAQVFNEPRAVELIRFLALRPLLEAAASIKVAELTRRLRFRSLAFVKLPDALANAIVSIALAPVIGVWALVAGSLAGPAAYLILSYCIAPHRPRLCFDASSIRSLVKYGRWIFLTGLITVAGSSVLRIVISRQLGVAELGLYYLAASLAFLPTEVASEVVGTVMFPLYARLQFNIQQATQAFRSVLTGLCVTIIPVFVLIIALAPSLVAYCLNERWANTVPLIRLLAIIGMLGLVNDAAVPVLKGTGQPNKFALIEGVQSLLLIVFAWGLTAHFGLLGTALAWFPAIIGSLLVSVVYLRRELQRPFAGLLQTLLAVCCAAAAGAAVALYIDQVVPGLPGFALATVLALGIMGVILWIFDRRLQLGFLNTVARMFPQVTVFARLSTSS